MEQHNEATETTLDLEAAARTGVIEEAAIVSKTKASVKKQAITLKKKQIRPEHEPHYHHPQPLNWLNWKAVCLVMTLMTVVVIIALAVGLSLLRMMTTQWTKLWRTPLAKIRKEDLVSCDRCC
jgi:hypothetical protein